MQPTINLLTNLDVLHPDVLLQHQIQPADYKGGLVFRSAIESIRGAFIASSTANREGLVNGVFDSLRQQNSIADYSQSSNVGRYDFTVVLERNPDYFAAIEVKGGEGNSINISERPLWAREFGIWCHLDGAVVNQPSNGSHSIINRVTNELVRRQKLVDVVFFKDILCGTVARPCPKYPGRESTIAFETAPDVFLFPQRVPSLDDPEPPTHSLNSLRLPKLILGLFGIAENAQNAHTWEVHVRIIKVSDVKLRREVQVLHQGMVVDKSLSKPWRL